MQCQNGQFECRKEFLLQMVEQTLKEIILQNNVKLNQQHELILTVIKTNFQFRLIQLNPVPYSNWCQQYPLSR